MGVQRFAFDIDTGIGTVTFAEGRAVDLAAVEIATREAGFDLKWTEFEVVGLVIRKILEGTVALSMSVRSRSQEILILPGGEEDTRANFAEVRRRAGESGQVLRIRGRARADGDGRVAMTIGTFEVVEGK